MGWICVIAFVGSLVFASLFTDIYEDSETAGINMWYLLLMLVGTAAGAYGLVGLSVWLVVVFPLVEMAWLSFSFGLYCLGCLMGLFK